MSRRKGDEAERDLSNWLEDEMDWYAQRTGASGAATDRARPDVIASRLTAGGGPDVALIEVKAWADATGQFDAAEVDDLVAAATRAGALPLVAIKPDLRRHDQWHCFPARKLHETPGGNYSVRKSDLPGMTRAEVFG